MFSWSLFFAVARRPRLWGEALRTMTAIAPSGWWRRPPFLPVPDAAYARWRLVTAHGDANAPLQPDELVHYLEWRKSQHRPLGRV